VLSIFPSFALLARASRLTPLASRSSPVYAIGNPAPSMRRRRKAPRGWLGTVIDFSQGGSDENGTALPGVGNGVDRPDLDSLHPRPHRGMGPHGHGRL